MRQAGIIAAAGIVALEQMVDRLAEDHANARLLAEGLASFPQITIDLATVQTDIVIFTLQDERWSPSVFVRALAERGLLVGELGYGRIRAVTHYGIDFGQHRGGAGGCAHDAPAMSARGGTHPPTASGRPTGLREQRCHIACDAARRGRDAIRRSHQVR